MNNAITQTLEEEKSICLRRYEDGSKILDIVQAGRNMYV